MNELLKGLIDAELTLLGVIGQATQGEPPVRTGIAQGKGAVDASEPNKDDSHPSVAFDQSDYRTAAG
jgi:hypothetical protein